MAKDQGVDEYIKCAKLFTKPILKHLSIITLMGEANQESKLHNPAIIYSDP